MNWKGTLTGILSSIVIASSGCRTISPPTRNPVNQIRSFENNNVSLEDRIVKGTAQSVEQVITSAVYKITDGKKETMETFSKSGSGTVIDDNDDYYHILTAHHVVEMPFDISSTSSSAMGLTGPKLNEILSSTTTKAVLRSTVSIEVAGIKAEVICSDEELDYALLRVKNNRRLLPLTKNEKVYLGDTDIIEVGDYLYSMGYPLGLDRFVTDGIISNIRFPEYYLGVVKVYRDDAFMFTSPISHGNSGGPVFSVAEGNLYLIGVVSGYYTKGNDLYVAFKINDILKDIRNKGFDIQEMNTKITKSYHKTNFK